MPRLRNLLKVMVLRTAQLAGAYSLASHSRWRQQRLLILAYHGISQADEHLWDPNLYMTRECFRQRLETLKQYGCNVIPLHEALCQLYEGRLPDLSVVLTFDDGAHDFYSRAYPLIQEYGFPVTVYLTTYYSQFNKPVFPGICSYLLWRARHTRLHLKSITGENLIADLATKPARTDVVRRLTRYGQQQQLSAIEKDQLAQRLSAQLAIDYEQITRDRILHILSPGEVSKLSSQGVDFQLHTHRHDTPLQQDLFIKEIEDNRESIRRMTGVSPHHFCYPNGKFTPKLVDWLQEVGVSSATTCSPLLATLKTNKFAIPRIVDTSHLSSVVFEGWICGLASLLARANYRKG